MNFEIHLIVMMRFLMKNWVIMGFLFFSFFFIALGYPIEESFPEWKNGVYVNKI